MPCCSQFRSSTILLFTVQGFYHTAVHNQGLLLYCRSQSRASVILLLATQGFYYISTVVFYSWFLPHVHCCSKFGPFPILLFKIHDFYHTAVSYSRLLTILLFTIQDYCFLFRASTILLLGIQSFILLFIIQCFYHAHYFSQFTFFFVLLFTIQDC